MIEQLIESLIAAIEANTEALMQGPPAAPTAKTDKEPTQTASPGHSLGHTEDTKDKAPEKDEARPAGLPARGDEEMPQRLSAKAKTALVVTLRAVAGSLIKAGRAGEIAALLKPLGAQTFDDLDMKAHYNEVKEALFVMLDGDESAPPVKAETAAKTAKPGVTLEGITHKARGLIIDIADGEQKVANTTALQALLAKYSVDRIGELPPDTWDKFHAELENIGKATVGESLI